MPPRPRAPARNPWLTLDGWRRLFRDRPLVPLSGLLIVLVAVLEIVQPGTVSPGLDRRRYPGRGSAGDPGGLPDADDADRRHRPVGRDDRLDGGVHHGDPDATSGRDRRDPSGPRCLCTGRRRQRDRRRRVQGPPADHDPRHDARDPGADDRLSAHGRPDGDRDPRLRPVAELGNDARVRCRTTCSCSCRSPPSSSSDSGTAGSDGSCSRSATTPSRPGYPGSACGRSSWPCTSLSALLAALAGFLIAGLVQTASVSLVAEFVLPSVAAAVIGGTSILGGRGGYSGTIVGALILTVVAIAPRRDARPRSGPPDPVRGDHRRRRGRVHAGDRRVVTWLRIWATPTGDDGRDRPSRDRPRGERT